MEDFKEDREMREFSWSNLFLVTGCCFILFATTMKLIEGSVQTIFLRVGIVCTILWTLSLLYKRLIRKIPVQKATSCQEEIY